MKKCNELQFNRYLISCHTIWFPEFIKIEPQFNDNQCSRIQLFSNLITIIFHWIVSQSVLTLNWSLHVLNTWCLMSNHLIDSLKLATFNVLSSKYSIKFWLSDKIKNASKTVDSWHSTVTEKSENNLNLAKN